MAAGYVSFLYTATPGVWQIVPDRCFSDRLCLVFPCEHPEKWVSHFQQLILPTNPFNLMRFITKHIDSVSSNEYVDVEQCVEDEMSDSSDSSMLFSDDSQDSCDISTQSTNDFVPSTPAEEAEPTPPPKRVIRCMMTNIRVRDLRGKVTKRLVNLPTALTKYVDARGFVKFAQEIVHFETGQAVVPLCSCCGVLCMHHDSDGSLTYCSIRGRWLEKTPMATMTQEVEVVFCLLCRDRHAQRETNLAMLLGLPYSISEITTVSALTWCGRLKPA